MATNYKTGMVDKFMNINTLSALMGIFGAIGLAVQFLGASFGIEVPVTYTLEGDVAVLMTVGAMAVAFASSDTRSLDYYEMWEKVLVGGAAVLIVGTQYITEISDIVMADDYVRLGAFAVGLAAWFVVSR